MESLPFTGQFSKYGVGAQASIMVARIKSFFLNIIMSTHVFICLICISINVWLLYPFFF